MRTAHDVIREGILKKLGVKDKLPYEESLATVEAFITEPLLLAIRCLIIAQERYGKLELNRKEKYDYTDFIYRRLELYKETGNREWLIDVLNGAILEFQFRSHPLSYTEHHDDHEHHQERIG